MSSRMSGITELSRNPSSNVTGWDKVSQFRTRDSRFVSFRETPDLERDIETRSRISSVIKQQDSKFIRRPTICGPRLNPLPYRHKKHKSTIPRYVPPPIPEEPVYFVQKRAELNRSLPQPKKQKPEIIKFKGKSVPPRRMISTKNGDALTCHIIGKTEPVFDPKYKPDRKQKKKWDMRDPGTSYSQRIKTPPPLPPSLKETRYRSYMYQAREEVLPLKFANDKIDESCNYTNYKGKEYWRNRVVREFKPKVDRRLQDEMQMMQTARTRRISPIKRVHLESLSATASVCTY